MFEAIKRLFSTTSPTINRYGSIIASKDGPYVIENGDGLIINTDEASPVVEFTFQGTPATIDSDLEPGTQYIPQIISSNRAPYDLSLYKANDPLIIRINGENNSIPCDGISNIYDVVQRINGIIGSKVNVGKMDNFIQLTAKSIDDTIQVSPTGPYLVFGFDTDLHRSIHGWYFNAQSQYKLTIDGNDYLIDIPDKLSTTARMVETFNLQANGLFTAVAHDNYFSIITKSCGWVSSLSITLNSTSQPIDKSKVPAPTVALFKPGISSKGSGNIRDLNHATALDIAKAMDYSLHGIMTCQEGNKLRLLRTIQGQDHFIEIAKGNFLYKVGFDLNKHYGS